MDPLLHNYHGRRQSNGGRNPRSLPLILAAADYVRWLSDEPNPHDLLWSFRLRRYGYGRSPSGSTSWRMMTNQPFPESSYLPPPGARCSNESTRIASICVPFSLAVNRPPAWAHSVHRRQVPISALRRVDVIRHIVVLIRRQELAKSSPLD